MEKEISKDYVRTVSLDGEVEAEVIVVETTSIQSGSMTMTNSGNNTMAEIV